MNVACDYETPMQMLTTEKYLASRTTTLTCSGVATGGSRGAECHPWQWNICKKSAKRGGKSGKKRKNREEKAKIGKVLSLCPSWQIGLATLLRGHLGKRVTKWLGRTRVKSIYPEEPGQVKSPVLANFTLESPSTRNNSLFGVQSRMKKTMPEALFTPDKPGRFTFPAVFRRSHPMRNNTAFSWGVV